MNKSTGQLMHQLLSEGADAAPLSGRRRALKRIAALTALSGLSLVLPGCSDGGASPAPGVATPPPQPPTPLSRLKAALLRPTLAVSTTTITVTQGSGNNPQSTLGSGVQIVPPLNNTGALTLATVPQVWGFRRDRWTVPAAGAATIAGFNVFPVTRNHPSATAGSVGVCGLHFLMDGRAFEVLFAGADTSFTLVIDGHYATPDLIATTLASGVKGASLAQPNTFVKVDFGSAATRRVSLYARSTQGPCAVAVAAGDTLRAWDRSDEASMGALADSYGGAFAPQWGVSGPFREAAAQLGIPHVDLDAVGGTGYAPNSVFSNAGDAFPARLASNTDTVPDLFITAGGINDNNAFALPPYATAAAARAGFDAAVLAHFNALRAALPQSVLVALGPWAPRQVSPTDAIAQSKADAILAGLQTAGGLWVFLDNLNGGWRASSGARGTGAGPWQTGTGRAGAPAGDGNGDLYLASDGVHPNAAGCLYLGTRIAEDLRSAIQSL